MLAVFVSLLLASLQGVHADPFGDGLVNWIQSFFQTRGSVDLYNLHANVPLENGTSFAVTCIHGEVFLPYIIVYPYDKVKVEKTFNETWITTTLGFTPTNVHSSCTVTYTSSNKYLVKGSLTAEGPVADLQLRTYFPTPGLCLASLEKLSVRDDARFTVTLDPGTAAEVASHQFVRGLEQLLVSDVPESLTDTWLTNQGNVFNVTTFMCLPES